MAKKTLVDICGASATYNATTGNFQIKASELGGMATPFTGQKLLFGLVNRNANVLTEANWETTNTDETTVCYFEGRSLVQHPTTGLWLHRAVFTLAFHITDANVITINSY